LSVIFIRKHLRCFAWSVWANLQGIDAVAGNVAAKMFALFAAVMGYLKRCLSMAVFTMQYAFRSSFMSGHQLQMIMLLQCGGFMGKLVARKLLLWQECCCAEVCIVCCGDGVS